LILLSKQRVLFLVVISLFLIIIGGCANTTSHLYTIKIYIKDGAQVLRINGVTATNQIVDVAANFPDYRARQVYAEVYQDGNLIINPQVNWSTDSPQCFELTPYETNVYDRMFVKSFNGSEMGHGKIFAEYMGETAEMKAVSYGRFELNTTKTQPLQDGYSFLTKNHTPYSGSDFYIDSVDTPFRLLKIVAPYGIKCLNDNVLTGIDAPLEPYTEPTDGDFKTEIINPSGAFEVISAAGIHYKVYLGCVETVDQINYSINAKFIWDYFPEPSPTP
jgi:hypothetical protein